MTRILPLYRTTAEADSGLNPAQRYGQREGTLSAVLPPCPGPIPGSDHARHQHTDRHRAQGARTAGCSPLPGASGLQAECECNGTSSTIILAGRPSRSQSVARRP